MKTFGIKSALSLLVTYGVIPLAIVLLLLSAPALAQWGAPNGMRTGVVGNIEAWADGRFQVAITGTTPMCNSSATSAWVIPGLNGTTSESARGLLSLFTAARLAGRSLTVFANNHVSPTYPQGICLVGAVQF